MGAEKTLTSVQKSRSFGNSRKLYLEDWTGQEAVTLGVGACELPLVCLKRPMRGC
jgi:hypothetical protein